MEGDNEVKGQDNSYTTQFRQYDPRISKWLSIDPVVKEHESPYGAYANNPIMFTDPNGADTITIHSHTVVQDMPNGNSNIQTGKSVDIKFSDSKDVFYYNSSLKRYDIDGNLIQNESSNREFDPEGKGYSGITETNYFFGYLSRKDDDRTTLAKIAPQDLIEYLVEKSDGWTELAYKDALYIQKSLPVFYGLQKVSEFAYSFYVGNVLFKGVASSLSLAVETSAAKSVLTEAEILRIQNAADRINKPITVVGSRASGTAGAYSDWDYVIKGLTNKEWKKIKNSIPGAPSRADNMPRMIDVFKGEVNESLPHITIYPSGGL